MAVYKVPMEFESENKIIGGILSLRQVVYILVAGSLDLAIFFFLGFLSVTTRVLIMVPISMIAVALAFYELPKHGRLDKFLIAYFRYLKKPKSYVQGRR